MSWRDPFPTLRPSMRALLILLLAIASPAADLGAQELPAETCDARAGLALALFQPEPGPVPAVGGQTRPNPEVANGVTCTYSPRSFTQGTWCGACGYSQPCYRETIRQMHQDCWICNNPSHDWCNEPVQVGSYCAACWCPTL